MTPKADSKVYHLKNFPGDFYTGHRNDGTQVFIGIEYPKIVAVLFDLEGKYLETLIKELSQATQFAFNEAKKKKRWPVFVEDWEELGRWAAELGFTSGAISIQKFCLPEYRLCVQDIPRIYQEFLNNGTECDERVLEQIENWKEVNDYVLVWGKEYDIDREGEVVST